MIFLHLELKVPFSLDSENVFVDQVHAKIPGRPVILLGWSIGALLACQVILWFSPNSFDPHNLFLYVCETQLILSSYEASE